MGMKKVSLQDVGDGVVRVPGVGVFQHGTRASVPRDVARKLLESEDWAVAESSAAALRLHVRVASWDGKTPPEELLEEERAGEEG